jgi:hypothetical protein
MSGLLLLGGRLSDLFGAKRIFAACSSSSRTDRHRSTRHRRK